MSGMTLRIGPYLEGWGIEVRGEWRGPYHRQDMAVQIATAEVKRRRAGDQDARMIVFGDDGTVVLEWPKPALELADLVVLEPESEKAETGVAAQQDYPVAPVRLHDWRDYGRRAPRYGVGR